MCSKVAEACKWTIGGRELRFDRQRLLLLFLTSILAVYLAFVAFQPTQLQDIIRNYGYYIITAAFVMFVYYAVRTWSSGRGREGVPNERWLWLWVGVGTLLLWGGDFFRFKVLFDEYVLQATSLSMHLDKHVSTPMRAHWLQGSFLLLDGYLDKRPYFLPYLVSLIHDITGYRVANVLFLNALLVPIFLWMVSRVALFFGGLRAAFCVTALLSTLPILAQVGSCGGMEMLNLTMMAVVLHAMVLYISEQSSVRLGYLCFGIVLFAQCRYESIVFVAAVALVLVFVWIRSGRIDLPVALLVTPLFMVPLVWQSRYVDISPSLWELKAGQSARFSVEYLQGNLEGMGNFFFAVGHKFPSSLLLTILGIFGAPILMGALFNKYRARRSMRSEWFALLAMGVMTLMLMGLFLFYYWARMDDFLACRFSLPIYLMLALAAALGISRSADGRPWVMKAFIWLWVINLSAFYFPLAANRVSTVTNMVSAEVSWEVDYINALPKVPRLIIGHSALPWIVNGYATVGMLRASNRNQQIEYHVREGTFHEVLVVQLLTPTSIEGDFTVLEFSTVPDDWKLETLAVKRFGGRLVRISRRVFDEVPKT